MNKVDITVAIPAYNRTQQLEVILKELLEQYDGTFDILVADDASPEDPTQMVQPYLEKMPRFRYIRNENNLGFSGNVSMLYTEAKTRYVWFLCDDDEITEDVMKNMQSLLEKHEPTVAVFNHLHEDPLGRQMNAGVEEDHIYNDPSELNNDYQPLMRTTFLSTLVLEKNLPVDEIVSKDYEDNVYFQVTLALHLLSDKFKYAEFAFPVVHRYVGYKYGDFFKFYMVDHLKAVHLIDHIFDNTLFIKWSIKNLPNALKLYYSQKVGLFNYQKQPTKETIKLLIKYYGIYCIPIALFYALYYITPKLLVRVVYYFVLSHLHGSEKAKEIYKKNVDRAYKDSRKTGFINYV